MNSDKRVTVWVQRFKDRPALMLQWTDPETGRRKSKSSGTDDPKEAEQRRADHEYELNHGVYQEAARMWWERFRDLFEAEHVAALRPNTRLAYQCTLDAFERICRPRTIAGVTERTLSAFVAGLRQTSIPSTIKTRLQHVRTALRWAAEQKIIPAAPKTPRVKVPKKRPAPVSADTFRRLLAATDDQQMRAFLLCGWLAGLRIVEAYSLEWDATDAAPWVDRERGLIVLPAKMAKADEDQSVPLDGELLTALDTLPRSDRRVFHFLDRYGEPATLGTVGQRVAKLGKKAGVNLTYRALRRGFGCEHAAHVPAQVLQSLMRHADIKTTMAYYVNTADAAAQAVRDRNSRRNGQPAKGEKPAANEEE
jgi:integrase